MKKLLFSVAALALTAGSALAADLPTRKAEPVLPPPPPLMWTGFYAGLNAGGTWANTASTTVASAPLFINYPELSTLGQTYAPAAALASSGILSSGNGGGFIGGGQIGYNFQFYDKFVVGIEADIQGMTGGSQTANSAALVDRGLFDPGAALGVRYVSGIVGISRNLDYIGTVRGRIGWLVIPSLLVYGTGGLAYGGVSSSVAIIGGQIPNTGSSDFASAGAASNTQTGWTAGGGLEWMFWPNWSAKVEYLYYDLGTLAFNPTTAVTTLTNGLTNFANGYRVSTHFNGNIVRAGVNYHFNWGAAPVVAKY